VSIHVLDSETINRIAAGEVIERPASVVKELTENSIDAGSSSVTIEIRDGGQSLIRVTDNGQGIPEEEVRRAFLRHATSKIADAGDLLTIRSLGFRGEALSSIAAVARTELITKTRAALTGTRCVIEGGEETVFEQVGAPEGTTIIVRDLFYCTPVRKKFLKSAATETAHIAELAEQLALSHPETSIRLIINGQRRFGTSGNGSLKDILYQLYGREVSSALLPVSASNEFFRLSGFLGKPELNRGNRSLQHFCINGRYIRSDVIRKALEDGYGTLLMQHSFPVAVLMIETDPVRVDVNVHPTKREVRFTDPQGLYEFLKEAVHGCLHQAELIRDVRLAEDARRPAESALKVRERPVRGAEPFEVQRRSLEKAGASASLEKAAASAPLFPRETVRTVYGSAAPGKTEPGKTVPGGPVSAAMAGGAPAGEIPAAAGVAQARPASTAMKDFPAQPASTASEGIPAQPTSAAAGEDAIPAIQERSGQLSFLNPDHRGEVRLIGAVFDTYQLAEWNGALYIIDQHAAHERVNYERLIKAVKSGEVFSQQLLPPIVLNLTDREAELVRRHLDSFRSAGYEIEPFGPRSYVVRGVPQILPSVMKDSMLREMVGELSEDTGPGFPQRILEKTASLSCKASIKGNQAITAGEAEKLLDELFSLEDPYHCPHGRPTVIRLTKSELDRRFRRIV